MVPRGYDKMLLNTVTTVLVALLGVHALLKFAFFELPYRRRRAALEDRTIAGAHKLVVEIEGA